jgi:hypothetical protein
VTDPVASAALALDVDVIVDRARAETGFDDFGGETWQEGLERLTASLREEAALHELGEQIAAGELVGYLSNRLRIVEWRATHPEVGDATVTPPIVIIGQGRTGTTILYDLLAQDPAHRVPRAWEVASPVPPPETATYGTDPRIDEIDAHLSGVDLVVPDLRAMHPLGARLAQECVVIKAGELRSMIFPTQYRVPSYAQWLLHEADMAPAYRWHRRFLEHLGSRHDAERWLLKSPGHIWALPELLAEYPDAVLVQTHRDPLRIIASIGSLLATLRLLGSDDTSIPGAAAEFADYILDGLDRSVTAREDGTVAPDRVVDVRFDAFMSNPFATIRGIYERFGIELTDDVERRMRAFLADNPQDKHGSHRYTFADTELDEGGLRERARRYQEHFDVPSEVLT